eukprot:CAMPEP_0119053206 /NCGR_PEP_ID=MMETSP1177-20130426/74277_1 /TAXON_ID=2985 /ORGANISM="Ochromonas sp, Strain CCMP1899" /LENGTH=116 /DNA_ID=CAMNT_0007033089 /DNA_START=241 /DNA_END=588 /DNA_ORIENTATION=+
MVHEDSFILEVQSPFSQLILNGRKCIETRAYPLPLELVNVKILLCESQAGENGVSCIGDEVYEAQEGIMIIGEIFVSFCKEYKSQDEWDKEREKHQVPEGSSYGWVPTEMGKKYGW